MTLPEALWWQASHAPPALAIYVLADDPDYMVFDRALRAGPTAVYTTLDDYVPVAIVRLEAGVSELVHTSMGWKLATNTGQYTAKQVYMGDAPGVAVTVAWGQS